MLIGAIYLILVIGCITMIYPFMIMISGSTKGLADMQAMDPIPAWVYSEQMKFARYVEDRYQGNMTLLSTAYSKEILEGKNAQLPTPKERAEGKKYEEFLNKNLATFPDHFYTLQEFTALNRILGRNYRAFRDTVKDEVETIDKFNERFENSISNWNEFPMPLDSPLTIKEFCYEKNAYIDRYLEFKRNLPLTERAIMNVDGYFVYMQKNYPKYRSKVWAPNPILAEKMPAGRAGEMWAEFVKHNLNCNYVKLDSKAMAMFRSYLVKKFPEGIKQFNNMNDSDYTSYAQFTASDKQLRNPAVFTLYTQFITNECPPELLRVDSPNTRYRNYIAKPDVVMPAISHDYTVFKEVERSYLIEISTRNYRNVIEYIVIYGRAIWNTLIFIGLSISAALIVNPLAAYALSRFNLKQTYTILMFFLTTMAFPGAVTMIPNFLLLKNLHLLNTFWALILPGVANGYSIFILKGFFDSIPKEVYESALIDGAGEWTMFWRFTMALSTPILALITLTAFTGAYTAFMFALIICPDERMWTLMVWLYQMQIGSAQPVIYAALVLAALPTLLVFVFAQNTIMKGIVIPVEK